MSIKWECQPHDAGWLITATLGDVAWAHHITRNHFKAEHEPDWAFWQVIRGLARNVRNFEESKSAKV